MGNKQDSSLDPPDVTSVSESWAQSKRLLEGIKACPGEQKKNPEQKAFKKLLKARTKENAELPSG